MHCCWLVSRVRVLRVLSLRCMRTCRSLCSCTHFPLLLHTGTVCRWCHGRGLLVKMLLIPSWILSKQYSLAFTYWVSLSLLSSTAGQHFCLCCLQSSLLNEGFGGDSLVVLFVHIFQHNWHIGVGDSAQGVLVWWRNTLELRFPVFAMLLFVFAYGQRFDSLYSNFRASILLKSMRLDPSLVLVYPMFPSLATWLARRWYSAGLWPYCIITNHLQTEFELC